MTSISRTGIVRRPAAFALVVVLLILGMLVVVAVGFLSSMTTERATAAAFSSKAKAEEAARAGVENAQALLQQSFRDFPDSATVWETQGVTTGGSGASATSANNDGTSLYVRAVPAGNDPTQPDPSTDNRPLSTAAKQIFVRPLVSGAKFMPIASKAQAVNGGTALSASDGKSVDINVRRSASDTQGFIGTPPGYVDPTTPSAPKPKPFRVPWVDIKEQSVPKVNQPPRTIARYAFWVEDESFKTNINLAGVGDTVSSTGTAAGAFMRRDNNKNAALNPTDLDLAGTFNVFSALTPAVDSKTVAQNVYNSRLLYPGMLFPEPRAFMHVSDMNQTFSDGSTLGDRFRFLSTTNSETLNLSRNGSQRLNLNSSATIATTTDSKQIKIQVEKLVKTMKFNLPKFGQRFYRNLATGDAATINNDTMVAPQHSDIYLYKVAANVRDFIDTDTQPTMVKNGGDIPDPAVAADVPYFFPPTFAWGSDGRAGDGANFLWAQGKERMPYLQETVMRFRPYISSGNFNIRVDYYLEFWNMSNRDISAAEMGGPFVRISSQMGWLSGTQVGTAASGFTPGVELSGNYITDGDGIGLSQLEAPQRDYDIDLTNGVYQAAGQNQPPTSVPGGIVFKAGACTIITTDPDFSQDTANTDPPRTSFSKSIYYYNTVRPVGGLNFATTYYCSKLRGRPNVNGGKRSFNGKMPTGANAIEPIFRDPSSSGKANQEDYETEVIMGNNQGYFDCAVATLPTGGGAVATFTPGWVQDRFHDYLNGGTLVGNGNTSSETGDPRTNNEQLSFKHFVQGGSIGQPDQSRYFNPGSTDSPAFTLGTPNSLYLQPGLASATFSPNAQKNYIQWKDFYDFPTATYPTNNPTADNAPAVIADGPLVSIGELGDVYDPARVLGTVGNAPPTGTKAIEYSRGGGRTFKIGQHDDLTDPTPGSVSNQWAAWRLTDIFSAGPTDSAVDDLNLPGRINLNGIARDNGAALQAALLGFVFQPATSAAKAASNPGGEVYRVHGDTHKAYTPSGKNLLGIQKLIGELYARIITRQQSANPTLTSGDAPSRETYGPLFERGELSELDIFGKNLSNLGLTDNYPSQANVDLVGNGDVNTGGDVNRSFDHTREEFFRRVVEMTCTRGNVFTAYVIGQAVTQPDPAKTQYVVNSSSQMRVTFKLNPVWKDPATGTDARNTDGSPRAPGLSDFDPTATGTTGGSLSKLTLDERFAKPDHYEVQVLYANSF